MQVSAAVQKMKILVVGPTRSGKTGIVNALAELGGDGNNTNTNPTVGVRILEVYRSLEERPASDQNRTLIELWDCSGDRKYENCWPALQKDADGIIFVFNPENKTHEREIETLVRAFTTPTQLRDSQCVIFAHHPQPFGMVEPPKPKVAKTFPKIGVLHTTFGSETIREEFQRLLQRCALVAFEKRDAEERQI
ncbi:putative intraflagellar transport protein 22 [Paratrimastix pyriformis]|uniref:Intraflagellar transport protein 22 n=1 Tax=Paratrimastix pyriformis TaxID=342808 RepID=A0ABQ8UUC7_9EUKA|nr:putative intraflagellar transport protein 22 [Paratrimastix pyriformis]